MDDSEGDEVLNVDSDNEVTLKNPTLALESEVTCDITEVSEGSVAARTDGIRGKRYNDYEIADSSGIESGECSESEGTDIEIEVIDVDDVVKPHHKNIKTNDAVKPSEDKVKNTKDVVKTSNVVKSSEDNNMAVLDEGCASECRASSLIAKTDAVVEKTRPGLKRPLSHSLKSSQDVYDIQQLIKVEPEDYVPLVNGVQQILLNHREVTAIQIDSSEDEEGITIKSEILSISSDDSDYCNKSLASDVYNEISHLSIRDYKNKEIFPQVEIVDLTLTGTEEIIILGKVFQIVDDFVVIKAQNPNKILDLDSLIFDSNRKCVGYVFELLGPVVDPYYSIHFNTNSDIKSLGLYDGQELFYSPNDVYSRYLLVEKLRELEHTRHNRQVLDSTSDSDCSDSSISGKASIIDRIAKRKKAKARKPSTQNRTTNNYTVNYKAVRNPQKKHYNSFTDQWTNIRQQPNHASKPNTSINNQSKLQPTNSSMGLYKNQNVPKYSTGCLPTTSGFQKSALQSFADPTPQMSPSNPFKSSVLASFLDPFSFDKPASDSAT